jgi:curved DNA-binding protein
VEYKDYYKIMGVARDATAEEIKRAYRKLARKYHPDVSKEAQAESKFKELGEAYEVLKDVEKRAAYDQLGADWQSGQQFKPPPNWDTGYEHHGGFADNGGSAYSDFFESLFGRGFGGRQGGAQFRSRGEDHNARILIDLEDAYHGATRNINLRTPSLDEQGHVRTVERTLKVRIPRGVKQGQHIRLTGQGMPGLSGGPAGDLYLELDFKPHPFYRIDGRDVYLDLPLTPWEAALGAKVKVPTPAGAVDVSIPANSAAGRKLRLKGRGIPDEPAGDLYVILQIALPPADSDKAKALFAKMQQELAFNPRSALGV